MLVKPISAPPAMSADSATADDSDMVRALLRTLDGTEFAAALCASDMPTKRGPLTVEQINEYAVQGIMRIGFDGAAAMATESRRLANRLTYLEDSLDVAERNWPDAPQTAQCARSFREYKAAWFRLWGGMPRLTRCTDKAYQWRCAVSPR